FAKRFHLDVDAILPVERAVILQGTAANFSRAFQVELKTHTLADGRSYRGREGSIRIPAQLANVVIGVFGLDARPVVRRHVRMDPLVVAQPAASGQFQTHGTINPFFGNQLAKLYNFPAGTDGAGETIGIVEIGGGFKQSDLDQYYEDAGITNPPHV